MKIRDLNKEDLEQARKIALDNYLEEREFVPKLPEDMEIPELEWIAENGLGVVAEQDGRVVGFIGVFGPFEGAYDTYDSLGVFSPLHTHGAIKENRRRIYQDMYTYASKKWLEKKIIGLGIALYAHDEVAKYALFEHGFGMRCKDAMTTLDSIVQDAKNSGLLSEDGVVLDAEGISFEELALEDFPKVRDMRISLDNHMKSAPVYMQGTEEERAGWLEKVEAGDRRTFVARVNGEFAGYLDVAETGENFVTYHPRMLNLQGAYCKPEYRGMKLIDKLLVFIATTLIDEGAVYLGVDYESYNPTANRFWPKHFGEYTNSVVRKLETWSMDSFAGNEKAKDEETAAKEEENTDK